MNKRTLGFKLTAGGIMLVLIPILVVGGFALWKANVALQDLAKGQAVQIAKNLSEMVEVALREEMKITSQLSVQPYVVEVATKASKEGAAQAAGAIEHLSVELAKVNKQSGNDYESIFVADASGTIIADGANGKLKGIAVGDRDYFTNAKAGKVNIGSAIKSRASGKPVVVVGAPVYGKGSEFVGVMAVILNIDFLSEKIQAVKIGESGYPWIIDKTGIAVSHPKKENIMELNLASLEGMKEITSKMIARQSGEDNYVFQGMRKIAGFAPIEHTTWSVAFTQNEDEFLASAHAIRNFILIIGAIFLTLTIVAVTFFSRSITVPITRSVSHLNEAADQVASASGQVSSASQSLAEGASEQAASIEETSSSLEEMSSMTKQNADNASTADMLMKDSRKMVERANGSMTELTKSMDDISKASDETSKIIKTIDEIAFQTNLLALNAAVEAARAGEAGAGFAVVANEVRNLAMRAAEAAKNTSVLIEGTVKKVKEGSELVERTNGAFSEVSTSAAKVADLVSEIAAASSEQAQGIDQINKAVAEMDKVTQQTAANAEESASASEQMNAQAEQMKQVAGELIAIVGGNVEITKRENETPTSSSGNFLRKALTFKSFGNKRNAVGPALTSRSKRSNPEGVIPLDDKDFKNF
jgi:methyl-accepting chemotaxis protein